MRFYLPMSSRISVVPVLLAVTVSGCASTTSGTATPATPAASLTTEAGLPTALLSAGEVAAEYRRRDNRAEVFGGWSDGLVDGWVRRISGGLMAREDGYAFEPGRTSPPRLPDDVTLAGPFVRYELLQDRYEKTSNLNQIGRSEYLALGLNASAQLARSAGVFGASREAWLYQAAVSRGFEPVRRHRLLASAALSGQLADGRLERQRLGLQAQYYAPHDHQRLFYMAISADGLVES